MGKEGHLENLLSGDSFDLHKECLHIYIYQIATISSNHSLSANRGAAYKKRSVGDSKGAVPQPCKTSSTLSFHASSDGAYRNLFRKSQTLLHAHARVGLVMPLFDLLTHQQANERPAHWTWHSPGPSYGS